MAQKQFELTGPLILTAVATVMGAIYVGNWQADLIAKRQQVALSRYYEDPGMHDEWRGGHGDRYDDRYDDYDDKDEYDEYDGRHGDRGPKHGRHGGGYGGWDDDHGDDSSEGYPHDDYPHDDYPKDDHWPQDGGGFGGDGYPSDKWVCEYGADVYEHGERWEADDGCNVCECYRGHVECTERSCDSHGGSGGEESYCGDGICTDAENRDVMCPSCMPDTPSHLCRCKKACERDCGEDPHPGGDHDCEPYVCKDGSRHPRCENGYPIDYFRHPCDDIGQPECDGHKKGERFPAGDGCNVCVCTEDGVVCTKHVCHQKVCYSSNDCKDGDVCSVERGDCNPPPDCIPGQACPEVCTGECVPREADPEPILCEGKYEPGEQYLAADGCNKCFCGPNGQGRCTKMACPHRCQSSDDCRGEMVCSVESGVCNPSCPWPELCPEDVCTGTCVHPAAQHECEDSDRGFDPRKYGEVHLREGDAIEVFEDHCEGDVLIENVCKGHKHFEEDVHCPHGCENGECTEMVHDFGGQDGGDYDDRCATIHCPEDHVCDNGECWPIDGGEDGGYGHGDMCMPHVCKSDDGHTYEVPSCNEDGHPINYFADPCMTDGYDEGEEDYGDFGDYHDEDYNDYSDYDKEEYDDYQYDYHYDEGASSSEPEYEDEVRTIEVEPEVSRFSDLDLESEEGKAANNLASKGIIGGRPSGEFDGEASVNRAEIAKFLLKARFGEVPEASLENLFRDTIIAEWYYKYVAFAARMGIIKGYADQTFRPGNTVNTAEFLIMASKTFTLPERPGEHSYGDVPKGVWFDGVAWIAQEYDLFPGRPDGTLQPERLLTRKEVAIAINRLLENL